MASGFNLVTHLIGLLQDTFKDGLNDGMSGLHLTHTLPTKKEDLPAIIVSFTEVKEEVSGLGDIVEVRRELGQDTQVIKANQIKGEMIFSIWIQKGGISNFEVLTKVDQASELLSTLFEEHKNDLRSHGLLRKKMIHIGSIESSEDAPVWLIQNTKALGKRLVYDFVYEFIAEEMPTEGVIEEIRVDEIKLDDELLSEKMLIHG